MKKYLPSAIVTLLLVICSYVNAQPVADAGPSKTTCVGSTVLLGGSPTASGGTAPYTFQWAPATGLSSDTAANPSATPSTETIYSVTVTDNLGATAVDTVTIYVVPQFTYSNVIVTNVLCNGAADGNISISVQGGSPPYLYSLDGGNTFVADSTPSGLIAGSYAIEVVDNNNCVVNYGSNPVVVSQPPTLNIDSLVTINTTCFGSNNGSIHAYGSGGVAPYSYSWNTGAIGQNIVGLSAGTYSVTITDAHGCIATSSSTVNQGAGLNTSLSNQQNVTCFGASDGSICAQVTGGSTPYTYAWSNGANVQCLTNISAGTYTCTVTDNYLCTATVSAVITQPAQLVPNLTASDVSCHGSSDGGICSNVSGGTPGYTYVWGGGMLTSCPGNLAPGTYHVTVSDNNGCTATASATVNEPAIVSGTFTSVDVTCNGALDGSITVTPNGGTPPYTFNWSPMVGNSPTISNLTAGIYTVTITDAHACTATVSGAITQPALISLNASVTNVRCVSDSGSIILNVTGGTGSFTYAWSNSSTGSFITQLLPGGYAVTVTDANNCSVTASYTITSQYPQVLLDSIQQINVTCAGGNNAALCASPYGGTAPYNYLWNNGSTASCANNLAVGIYTVTIYDANLCSVSLSTTVIYTDSLHVDSTNVIPTSCNHNNDGSICVFASGGSGSYYYNWSNGQINVSCINNLQVGGYAVTITDLMGCTVTATAAVTNSLEQCVWPGDANYDGVVDNLDLFPIGLAYGATGPGRPNANITFTAQYCQNWTDSLQDSINYKHIDCNGDGTINDDDTLAIIQNFSLVHPRGGMDEWRSGNPVIYTQITQDTVQNNDTLFVTILLGDANQPANNVYGVAFTVNYNPLVVDTNKTRVTFGSSWLGTSTDEISIAKDLKASGEIKCGVTRIDHVSRNGNGPIGQIAFVITTDNINGIIDSYLNVNVWISNVVMIDGSGTVLPLNAGGDSTKVGYIANGIKDVADINSLVKMFPNPANQKLSITSQLNIQQIKILDVVGQAALVTTVPEAHYSSIDLSQLSAGIYFVEITTAKGVSTQRLVINR